MEGAVYSSGTRRIKFERERAAVTKEIAIQFRIDNTNKKMQKEDSTPDRKVDDFKVIPTFKPRRWKYQKLN